MTHLSILITALAIGLALILGTVVATLANQPHPPNPWEEPPL